MRALLLSTRVDKTSALVDRLGCQIGCQRRAARWSTGSLTRWFNASDRSRPLVVSWPLAVTGEVVGAVRDPGDDAVLGSVEGRSTRRSREAIRAPRRWMALSHSMAQKQAHEAVHRTRLTACPRSSPGGTRVLVAAPGRDVVGAAPGASNEETKERALMNGATQDELAARAESTPSERTPTKAAESRGTSNDQSSTMPE